MSLRTVFAEFGIKVTGLGQLTKANAKMKQTIGWAESLGKSINRIGYYLVAGAIVRGVRNLIEGQFDAAVALKYNAERLGVSTEELQKYEYAAGRMHVGVTQTAVALRFFNSTIGKAALGTKASVKVFRGLGIQIKDTHGDIKPTADLLYEFADKLEKKFPDQARRTAYAMNTLGRGGSSLLPVLQQGSEKLKEIFKDVDELGGGFNDKFIAQSVEVDIELKRLKFAWRSIYVAITTEVLPVVKRWVDSSIQHAKTLIDWAKHTYAFRTALVALTAGGIIYGLTRLMKMFNPFKTSIKDVMMALLANAPLVIFIGLLIAAYLAFDDLYAFLKGGDSFIGQFFNQHGLDAKAFKENLVDAFHKVVDSMGPLIPKFKELGESMLVTFGNSIPQIVEWGGVFLTYVVGAIDAAVTGARELAESIEGITHLYLDLQTLNFAGLAHDSQVMNDRVAKLATDQEIRSAARDNIRDALHGLSGNSKPRGPEHIKPGDPKFVGPLVAPPEENFTGLPPPPLPPITVNITGLPPAKVTVHGGKSSAVRQRDAHAAVNAGVPQAGATQ